MRPFENESELAAALGEMRPAPAPEFAARLDARAAAGFPRESRLGAALGAAGARLAAVPPRRLIAPAGAFAVAAIVVATTVVAINNSGDAGSSADQGNVLGYLDRAATPAREAAAGGEAETQSSSALPAPSSGPYAADAGRRQVERSAEVVLGAEPEQVRADAAKVFTAVQAADGIVLGSSITDGGSASAEFTLLIPSDGLGDALAAISRIGEVRSRHEATDDITAPTVRTAERLQDTRARIDGLLGQLAEATTDDERAVVESRLRAERARAGALRSRLSSLHRRANLSRVSVRIESGGSSENGAPGAWGAGDGVDGAGRILAVAAGVAVIGLALLSPFALLTLAVWLGRRAWISRSRRAALGRA
jgi:Domain of unknown function (DUF4349)